jgi:hypothetical protein
MRNLLRAEFWLPLGVTGADIKKKPPVQVKFEIPGLAISEI